MKKPTESEAIVKIPKILADLFSCPKKNVRLLKKKSWHGRQKNWADMVLNVDRYIFAVKWKNSSSAAYIASVVRQIKQFVKSQDKEIIPVVAVPYMGEVGVQQCREMGVSWLDLSGNAHIEGPILRIHIEGKPNLFVNRGRPSSGFAPKSSRIARHLLRYPDCFFTQKQVADATALGEGYTSKIIKRLEKDDFIIRNENREISIKNANLFLDAWREVYDFKKHRIIPGVIAARSSETLLRQTASILNKQKIEYAATGLGAAWLLTQFAAFRIVSFYFRQYPNDALIKKLDFHEGERGANVWLIIPNDEGVFQGVGERDQIKYVHPVQIYLDLIKGHPERAREAAEQLRKKCFDWRKNDREASNR